MNRSVFDPHRFAALRSLFEELLGKYGPDQPDVIHSREPRLLSYLLADEVLDLVEPLVGPDIGLWSSHFISKAPRVGKATPWHEDSAYWQGRVSTMEGIVTVWLAIDSADRGNGAMGVIPGTHRNGNYAYQPVALTGEVFDRQIRPDTLDTSQAVYASLAPNECTVHDCRIVHGADPNTSHRRRAGYTMRYFPTTTLIVPEANRGHAVWLARGRDHAGNRYANVG